MLSPVWGIAVIICMTVISKSLRSLAFGRADSIALEVAICSFLYCTVCSILTAGSVQAFMQTEVMRCAVLLLFAFVIAAVHRHYKDICMAKVRSEVEKLRAIREHTEGRFEDGGEKGLEETVLDETELLAQQAIDVWYSEFADRLFYRILPRRGSGDVKSFKKKKTLVRWSFANLLNGLGIMDESDVKLRDSDFNIDNRSQITGMLIFDALMILSVLVAVRII